MIIILIIILQIVIFCQKEEPIIAPVEIFTVTAGYHSENEIKFILSSVSGNWGRNNNTFSLVNNINIAEEIVLGNTTINFNYGFNIHYHLNVDYDIFYFGLYKCDIYEKNNNGNFQFKTFFYLEYRDCNLGNEPMTCPTNDIIIKIDSVNGLFYQKGVPNQTTTYEPFNEGDILKFWEIAECNQYDIECFPDYWQNSLALIDDNFHPKLIWSTDSDEITVTSYKIYRAISWEDSETPPSSNNFIFLNQVNSSTDQYVDYNTLINGKSNIWYKIIAYNGTTEVEEFNIVKTNYTNDMWGKSFNVTKYNNNTHLEWKGYYDEVNNYLDYYRIYRAVTGSGSTFFDPPGQGSFSLIGSVMAELLDLYTFTDYEISTNGQLNVYYYIKPLTMYNQELEPTEIVGMNSVSLSKEVIKNEKKDFEIKYTLLQNHPNPFNPVTNIKYQIKEKGFVTIKIFDILGNEITTLVNEIKDAGVYSIVFDGSKLPSGVYIYNMQTHDITLIQKMTLIK